MRAATLSARSVLPASRSLASRALAFSMACWTLALRSSTRWISDRLGRAALGEGGSAREAGELEARADRLEATGHEREYWGFAEAANAGDTHAFFDRSPIIGVANPIAPPVTLWLDGEIVRGSAGCGTGYGGPAGPGDGGARGGPLPGGAGLLPVGDTRAG